MKPLTTATFEFEFLTSCFSGTAEGKNASFSELRVPPIRGHIRMWHVKVFGARDANAIWGSTAGDGIGSRVAISLNAQPPRSTRTAEILPHKENRNHRGPRAALPAGSRATVVLTRLPQCNAEQWDHAQAAAKVWLLLGTLGLRSARAAGSVWPCGAWVPSDPTALKTTLAALNYAQPVKLVDRAILDHKDVAYETAATGKLRHAASDTVSGSPQFFGGIKPERKPSPLRMKIVRFSDGEHLLLTGLSADEMSGAHVKLKGHPLGDVPWHSL